MPTTQNYRMLTVTASLPPPSDMCMPHHNFVRGPAPVSAFLVSTIYPLATGFHPWLAMFGIGKGGFLSDSVKKTGCLTALS